MTLSLLSENIQKQPFNKQTCIYGYVGMPRLKYGVKNPFKYICTSIHIALDVILLPVALKIRQMSSFSKKRTFFCRFGPSRHVISCLFVYLVGNHRIVSPCENICYWSQYEKSSVIQRVNSFFLLVLKVVFLYFLKHQ